MIFIHFVDINLIVIFLSSWDILFQFLHFLIIFLIELILQIGDSSFKWKIINILNILHKFIFINTQFQSAKHSLHFIYEWSHQLFFVNWTWKERDLAICVNYLSDCFRGLIFLLLILVFQLLQELTSAAHPEILVQEATIGFVLTLGNNINFIDNINMRHFQIYHCRQSHHAEGNEGAYVWEVGAVE